MDLSVINLCAWAINRESRLSLLTYKVSLMRKPANPYSQEFEVSLRTKRGALTIEARTAPKATTLSRADMLSVP